MNIFVTSPEPDLCAKYLDDKRVIKMVLETAQLLSTAIHAMGGTGPYKPTHLNHPCSIWVRESRSNYQWTLNHFKALLNQYTIRYGKIHKCQALYVQLRDGMELMLDGGLTPFVNCTTYKDTKDTYDAYKQYLNDKWSKDIRIPTWHRLTCSTYSVSDQSA
jgi:hypothetical protein